MHKSELQAFDGGFSFFAGHPTLSIPIIWYNQCNSSISLEFSWDLRMENRTHALCTPTTRHACSRLCYHPSWSWRKRKAFERHPVPKCIFDKKLLLQSVKCSKIQQIRKKNPPQVQFIIQHFGSFISNAFTSHGSRMIYLYSTYGWDDDQRADIYFDTLCAYVEYRIEVQFIQAKNPNVRIVAIAVFFFFYLFTGACGFWMKGRMILKSNSKCEYTSLMSISTSCRDDHVHAFKSHFFSSTQQIK